MSDQTQASQPFTKSEIRTIMSGLMLVLFLANLDQTIVATSLSAIAGELGGWYLISWVVSAYLVASTVTTPIYGRLSDIYGRRPILLFSVAVFVLGSAFCALAETMPQLVAARVIQGLGGGGFRSVSLAVVADILPPRERGRYQGYLSSVFGTANVVGPVLGGLFVDYLSWQWIFWINLPLGAIAFALTYRQLKRLQTPPKPTAIDWLGAVLILLSATPILLGITNVERSGRWDSVATLAPLAIGALFMVALILRERTFPEPMLPLRLFRSPIFSVAMAITFLSAAVMIAMIFLIPLYHQLAGGASAKEAGLRLIPLTIGTVMGSFIGGQLVSRWGRYRIFPIVGTTTGAIVTAAIAFLGLGHSWAFDVAVTLLLGLSFGGQLSPMTVTVQNALDARDGGVGISCMLFFRLMGGAFGVSLLSAILIATLTTGAAGIPGHEALGPNPGLALFHLEEHAAAIPPELLRALLTTTRGAFSTVFAVASAILACAAVISLFLKEIPLRSTR